ncbi:MAG: ATP-binding protein, partial [Bacteroidota bacterium]
RDDGMLLFNFSDNGFGIDIEKAGEKLFQMYQRYHLDIPGRGIGLYIVKNRISSLGGTISLKSEEGNGTELNISLPEPT